MTRGQAIPSWCRVGARVVCVNDGWSVRHLQSLGIEPPSRVPMLNEVLTIRLVRRYAKPCNEAALAFEELPGDFAYPVSSFRPLVTRTQQQDISEHFRRYLDQPVGEDA